MRGTFVGRVAEIASVGRLCEAVREGSGPAAALILGEPGSGKSRLLHELSGPVAIPDQIAICGYELEQRIPLAAARGLLQRLGHVRGAGEALETLAFGREPAAGSVEAVRVFESAHRAAAALGPLLVLIDDLHWADDTSIALIHYLLRAARADQLPLAVVATSRPAAVAESLQDSLRALLGDRFAELELAPLDRDAGVRLARALAPQLDTQEAEQLWRRAGGSPFWLQTLARGAGNEADVERVVDERLRRIGADAAALIGVLALAARPLSVDELAEILGWPPARAVEAASSLERSGLATGARVGDVGTAHDLIRGAVVRTLEGGRARRIHRQLATWLAARAGDDERLLLAALEHHRAGGQAALDLVVRLARSPRRRLLGADGLRRLITLADEAGPGDPHAAMLLEDLGTLASELGAHEEALRIWSERASGPDPEDHSRAALRASEAALELARPREAWRHLERARAGVRGDPVQHAEVLAQEAALQQFLDRSFDRARVTAGQALDAARGAVAVAGGPEQIDERTRRAWLRAVRAALDDARMRDDPEQMLALAEERGRAAAGFDDRVEVEALAEEALALRFLGHNKEAATRLRRAWDRARHRVLPQAVLDVGATLGRVHLSMGHLEEAVAVVDECEALGARLIGFRAGRAFMVTLPALVKLTTGDWQQAVADLRSAAAAEPEPHYRLQAHMERAAALARLDPDRARPEVLEAVAAALADADVGGCRRCSAEASLRCGEALARVGASADARAMIAGARIPPADAHLGYWHGRAAASVVMTDSDPAVVVAALEEVLAEAQRQTLTLETLWVRLDIGALLATVDRGRAASRLREAGADAERIGAVTESRVADHRLRSLGVRTWRRTAATVTDDPLGTLTDREREIARWVATGASNPEIAAAVFLSRKTVERHISNILAKLSVRNRAELAALVADRPPQEP